MPGNFLFSTVGSTRDWAEECSCAGQLHPTVPVASFWDKGIRSVFDNSSTPPAKIDIEYLYHHRIQDPHYRKLLVDLFHYKYSKEKPDLVIALYSGALDFELEVGSDLFQDIHAELKAYENTFDYFDVKLIPFNVKDIKFEAVGVLGDEINKGVAIRCKWLERKN